MRPADGLVHPVPLVAMIVLALNDHWAKAAFPGALTGKLSDLAGLAFFPLLLQALWELARRRPPSRRALVVATIATGVVFAATKTAPAATAVWAWALGVLQWPALALLHGQAAPLPVRAVCDPTDLVALPALGFALWAGWRRDEREAGGREWSRSGARSGTGTPVEGPAVAPRPPGGETRLF